MKKSSAIFPSLKSKFLSLVHSKKGIEFQVIVIAIIALVALAAGLVIFSTLAGGAGGKVSAQIGAVNVSVPNIYDVLGAIGAAENPCTPLDPTKRIDLELGENDVCWSPPASYGKDDSEYTSPFYYCKKSRPSKVFVDLDLEHKEDVFEVRYTYIGEPGGNTAGPFPIPGEDDHGPTFLENAERTIPENARRILFAIKLDDAPKTHSFYKHKGAVVRKIICSEGKVDLVPILTVDTPSPYKASKSVKITFGVRNDGVDDIDCMADKVVEIKIKDDVGLLQFSDKLSRKAGESCSSITKQVTWTPNLKNTYTIEVTADPNSAVDELLEDNNVKTASVTVV